MREQLDRVVAEMVDRGVHFDDAQREFERRFISRVVAACDGNVSRAAEVLGMHRNTLTRKVTALKIRLSRSSAA
ncbi:MAG: helix-turn-helix domain-containing protein [Vicinamibacterales bacterium]